MVGTSRRHLAVVVAGALLVGGCTGPRAATLPPPLTIGVLAPTSGPDAARGTEAVHGVQLAIEVVNNPRFDLALPYADDTGVRNGSRLALVTGDTAGDPAAADRMARVQGALGLVVSDPGAVGEIGARAERLGVPLIDADSSDDGLAALGRRCYFRIVPTDRTLAGAVFGLIRQQRATGMAVRRITVVAGQSSASASALAALKEAAAAVGNDFSSMRYREQPTEVDGLVSQLNVAGADLVIATATTAAEAQAAALLTDRLHDRAAVIVMGRAAGGLAASGPGAGALRSVGWSTRYVARNPTATALDELYRSRFGSAMTETAVTAFTATLTLARALDTAERADTVALRAALRRVWFAGTETVLPWNGVRFDAAGQNELAAALVEQRTQPGFQIVYPTELSSARVVWPQAKSTKS